MFTGLIEETGMVKSINMGNHSGILSIQANDVLKDTKIGDSIAVNGVCLTVTGISGNTFQADVMAETYRRSSLGYLKINSRVNLERAMLAGGRFGGHIVSGHIDGTGIVKDITIEENAIWYSITTDSKLLKYIIEKGSITIDGISLTVAYADQSSFKVSIIPHTRAITTLKDRKVGDLVNLECDMIGKYVERLLQFQDKETENQKNNSKLTLAYLQENGF